MESYMHISNRCAPWNIANGAENPVLQALQFQQMGFCRKFPGGTLHKALLRSAMTYAGPVWEFVEKNMCIVV
jgi:hypothetical protein